MTNAQIQQLIQAVEQADSAASLVASVRALAATQSEAVIPSLIAVFGYNNPGAALAAVDGLVQLGKPAVPPLLSQLDGYNYGARAYSIRALAEIADPRALEVLVAAATTDFAPSVRRAAAKGLGKLDWHQPPEQSAAAQTQAFKTLEQISKDSDWAIRYSAVVGLQSLANNATDWRSPTQSLLEQLLPEESDRAVKARIKFALSSLTSTSN
ncbi:MAG: HEAT repeat domain-containing protein [Kastovskya adunca ATA6-11-RM4]|jgi:phycocyanobilin lyase beta subunit|nr:HEAT repeat domain-containing protein [Kastovskya adunca ATA6-11-RM4]